MKDIIINNTATSIIIIQTIMFFTTDIDLEDKVFAIVFIHDTMRLECLSCDPAIIKMPIEEEGYIKFGYPGLTLSWDKNSFAFSFNNTGDPQGGSLYFSVAMTPELLTSFKAAVGEWNHQLAIYEELQNRVSDDEEELEPDSY